MLARQVILHIIPGSWIVALNPIYFKSFQETADSAKWPQQSQYKFL